MSDRNAPVPPPPVPPSRALEPGRPEAEPAGEPAGPLVVEPSLSRAMRGIAADLWGRLGESRGNLACSPASIATALLMTWGGARGETAAEMARVLRLEGEAEATHRAAERFLRSVADPGARPYALHAANRLFGDESYAFLEPFLVLTRERYLAPLEAMDFGGAPEPSRLRINGWVAEETRDRIEELLPPLSIDADTRLVLVNALYFRGPWQSPFQPFATRPEPFHVSASESPAVPTMHDAGYYGYAEVEGVRLLGLPYAGGALQMTIVLPAQRGGLTDVEASLEGETLERWMAATSSKEQVAVALPRFAIRPAEPVALREHLDALGMPLAFDRRRADFTGIAAPPSPDDRLFITEVYHQAFVEVDEQGTEAAAATAVVMAIAGCVPPPAVPFRADHPFLFLIHTRETNALLFMGRVADPR